MKTTDSGSIGNDGKWRAGKLTIVDSVQATTAFFALVNMAVLIKNGYSLRIK